MMKTRQVLRGIALLALAGFAACSTLTVDRTRASAIHRVALAGFSVVQEVPPGFQWTLGGGEKERYGGAPQWTSGLGKQSPSAEEMYTALQKTLKTEFKWTVLDRAALTRNTEYRTLYDQKMTGLQSRPPGAANTETLAAGGVIDSWPIERLDLAGRKALISKLGVDALAVATVRITLEKAGGLKRLVGAGEYKPKATVSFVVYDGKSEAPVWRDLAAQGEAVEKGVGHVLGATDQKSLSRISVEAAQISYNRLVTRYREAN